MNQPIAPVSQPMAVWNTFAKLEDDNQKMKVTYHSLRTRVEKLSQATVQDSQEGFGFGIIVGLLASVGLAISFGIATVRTYFGQGQLDTELGTIPQIPLVPQRAGQIAVSIAHTSSGTHGGRDQNSQVKYVA